VDWSDLKYALVVAREGTLAGAGRALGVNHSTVLRRIKALEEQLGVSLFERHPRGYVTTPAGDELVAAAQEIEERTLVLERRLGGHDQRLSGSVKVSTSDVVAEHLTLVLRAFREAYPKIAVELDISNELRDVERGETDIALRFTRSPPEQLVGRRICRGGLAVYAAESYLAGRPEPLRADAVDWIVISDPHPGTSPLGAWHQTHVPPDRIAARMGAVLAAATAVRSGLGVGLLPCGHADMLSGLVRVGPVIDELDYDLWLLTHSDLRKIARVRVVLDWIGAALDDHRAFIEGKHPRIPPRPAVVPPSTLADRQVVTGPSDAGAQGPIRRI